MAIRPRSSLVLTLAFAAVAAPAAAAPALDLFYERALMSTADGRCRLFEPQVGAALMASAAQARGAALRAGVDGATVNSVGARARARALSVDCASPDLKVAADRVRTAFASWRRTAHMDFPGEAAAWKADRTAYRSPAWRLVQTSHAGAEPVLFGVAGRGESTALVAVAAFDGARPYAARLIYRDASRAPSAWVGAPMNRPLPPRSASRLVLAEDVDDASVAMTPKDCDSALAFRFPASALEAMTALDPRERFAVEFLFSDDRVKVATFEVGDLAAGRAFLNLGPL
jgi:hypothetical protein